MSRRQALLSLLNHGLIPANRIDEAITVSEIQPNHSQWLRFLDRFLLLLGAISLACAVIFFVAFNWAALGKYAKFLLVECALIGAISVYLSIPRLAPLSQAMLLCAALILGALLALFGQTYQTGADPWQLFFFWAMLIMPWVVISRSPSMWLLWVALLNISVVLYFKTFGGALGIILLPLLETKNGFLWCVFFLNTCALFGWEMASKRFTWLKPRWAPRSIAVAAGVAITWLALAHIVDAAPGSFLASAVWILWAAGVYFYYRRHKPDLFMLAGLVLSLAIIVITYIAEPLFEQLGSAALLIIAVLIIGAGSTGALWLRRVNATWET